jgi:TolB-like protein/cytochrome c-type biogenesis protein CcmH/NrfG
MRNFFGELKRRKVYRVAVAYAIVAWLVIQIATQTFPFLGIPNWAIRLVIILIVLGFPVALVLAWAFDLTAQGIKRTDDIAPEAKSSAKVPDKSIAVLPFENLSDNQENAYFADGVQDDILSNLAKVADLKVISRTSVRQYRTGVRNLREIGAALGVAHILEGTVRRSGNRVRINTQLINARTDAHVWADTFDREATDLFALQSELAEKIANALRANLSPWEKASMQVHPTAHLDAYDLYLRARDLFRWSGAGDPRENGEKALRLLDQAIARDPQFALAYSLASRFHGELYWFGFDKTRARLAKAKAALDTALRLHPELGDAHLALGYHYYYGYRDYERARAELAIALRATPNDAEVWDGMAAVARRQGKWDEAVSNFERARQLDPHNAAVIWNLAETYLSLCRFEDAEKTFADGLTMNPQAQLFSLARGAINLKKSGSTSALCAAVKNLPRDFDPGGAVTTVAVRLSLMNRDYVEAARWLEASSRDVLNDAGLGGMAASIDGYSFPRTWYEGLIARGRGDKNAAQRAFTKARATVQADLRQWPDDAKTNIMLGLVDAILGRRADALKEGRRAAELLPISTDAFDGPAVATNLAVVYAQLGERELALEQLAPLLEIPNGPTRGMLRVEPEWDQLRGEPRFAELAGRGD